MSNVDPAAVYEPFKGCRVCAPNNGYIYTTDDYGNPMAKRCRCLIQWQKRQQLRTALAGANISLSMLDYSVDSYVGETSAAEVEKLKKYVKEFKTRYRGVNLYMYGPNSTQKTTLAKWLGVELLRRDGASVHYVLMDQLVKELTQEGFDEDVDPNLKIYRTVDVLIIDEAFDKAKVQWFKSGYQMSYLDRFLRQRMEQDENLSTILISNNDVESIRDNFNNSLYELIDRNTAGSKLQFQDHYAQANNFNPEDLWT